MVNVPSPELTEADELPPVPQKDAKIPRWECIGGMVFCAAFAVLFLFLPQLFFVIIDYGSRIPIFSAEGMAESWYLLDRVAKVPYALMGTEELAVRVAGYAEKGCRAMLLENHGALTIGNTLLSAFDRMECLEQAAKLTYLSKAVHVRGLSGEERAAIARMR